MRLKFLVTILTIFIISNILILGFPPILAVPEELNEDITIPPNSTRELTIEVKKGTDIEFNWNISGDTQTVDFKIIGKTDEGLPDIKQSKSAGSKEENMKGEKYTFVWANLDTEKEVTLRYIISYEPKLEEETGCYTTAILLSVLTLFIIFSAFGFSSKKH